MQLIVKGCDICVDLLFFLSRTVKSQTSHILLPELQPLATNSGFGAAASALFNEPGTFSAVRLVLSPHEYGKQGNYR